MQNSHLLRFAVVPALTREERQRLNALPRPNPPMGGKVVIRRRPGREEVRVHRGQAQMRAKARDLVGEGGGLSLADLVNTAE